MSRKRVPLNQNECTADFRIGVPFEQNLQSSSALATIQEKLEEVNNINTTTLALKGVSKLIQKGLTLSEIKYLTGVETKKIEEVSRWLMNQEDVESVINNKLNLIDI